MKIILANGIELNPILVTGEKRTIQGLSRDTLRFVFSSEAGLVELDNTFTASACESIIIEDGSDSYLHKGYTIRAELKKESVEVVKSTPDTDAVYEDRIIISMSQRTYAETQLAEMQAAMNALLTGEG